MNKLKYVFGIVTLILCTLVACGQTDVEVEESASAYEGEERVNAESADEESASAYEGEESVNAESADEESASAYEGEESVNAESADEESASAYEGEESGNADATYEESDASDYEYHLDFDYKPRTEITDDYIAVFHGGSGELTYQTYVYKLDTGAGNYGFEYINSELYGMTASDMKEKITGNGVVMWTDDVFEVARDNLADEYVTIPGSSNIYSIDEFSQMFLMN